MRKVRDGEKVSVFFGGARQRLFTRNDGTKHEDRVWLIEHLKRADILIEVPDDDADFDLEKLRKNENDEWRDYDWILEDYVTKAVDVDCDDEKVCAHYQEILAENGFFDVEDALGDDGFTETGDDDRFDETQLFELEEITS